MTTLQTGDDCQTNDSNDLLPIAFEPLRFPLDNSMHILFSGYFNGFNVEIRSADETALLYHLGCFGKGSASRSKPKVAHNDGSPCIMRKRQFLKRNYWYKKFSDNDKSSEFDLFLKDVDEVTAKIVSDGANILNKDVIDLVSSDDNDDESEAHSINNQVESHHCDEKQDIVVIVPNSDSEDDNYFAKLKPKCCLNKVKIQEKLMLTLQEAYFLLYGLGCLQIVDVDNKLLSKEQCWRLFTETDRNFVSKYVVYHYFRSKGYIVKCGIKFGAEYVLYREGPGISHADYVVIIKQEEENMDWIYTLGHVRMSATIAKEMIIAEVIKPCEPVNLPQQLSAYSVREILLTRKIPVTINDDID